MYTLIYTALNVFVLAAEVTMITFLLLFQPNHCCLFQTLTNHANSSILEN
jgi:hypothetical protein